MAFWINIYNALVLHGGLAVPPGPADPEARGAFFSGASGVRYRCLCLGRGRPACPPARPPVAPAVCLALRLALAGAHLPLAQRRRASGQQASLRMPRALLVADCAIIAVRRRSLLFCSSLRQYRRPGPLSRRHGTRHFAVSASSIQKQTCLAAAAVAWDARARFRVRPSGAPEAEIFKASRGVAMLARQGFAGG